MKDASIKHIELTHREWENLRECIKRDYGASTLLISWKLKEALGFTVREHRRWIERDKILKGSNTDWRDQHSVICLDFYDEQYKILFLLKYS